MKTAVELGPHEFEYEPPESAMKRAIAAPANASEPSAFSRIVRRVAAILASDSFNEPLPSQARDLDLSVRRLRFRADELEVDLTLQVGQDEMLTLAGQMFPHQDHPIDVTNAEMMLISGGDAIVRTSNLNTWGEFLFNDLPQANYSLRLSLEDRIVDFPTLPNPDR